MPLRHKAPAGAATPAGSCHVAGVVRWRSDRTGSDTRAWSRRLLTILPGLIWTCAWQARGDPGWPLLVAGSRWRSEDSLEGDCASWSSLHSSHRQAVHAPQGREAAVSPVTPSGPSLSADPGLGAPQPELWSGSRPPLVSLPRGARKYVRRLTVWSTAKVIWRHLSSWARGRGAGFEACVGVRGNGPGPRSFVIAVCATCGLIRTTWVPAEQREGRLDLRGDCPIGQRERPMAAVPARV